MSLCMKIKDFKEWCEQQDENEEVIFCKYSNHSERYTKEITSIQLKTCLPKKTSFEHNECKCYEIVNFKEEEREYCNRLKSFIDETVYYHSCEHFNPLNEKIKFCLNCERCVKNYTCNGLYND